MIIADAIGEFTRRHGHPPVEVLVARGAAVVLAATFGELAPMHDGVSLRVVESAPPDVAPGTGASVALVVTELRGGVLGVVAHETGSSGG